MAKAKAAKAAGAGAALTARPYVQRLIEDEDLRSTLLQAFGSTKDAYGRLTNGKPATKVLDDKKLHKEVKQAAESLRDAGQALREGPKKKKRKRRGFGKLLILGLVGAGAAVALSEGLRNKVLDTLFGAEEEFDYTSTTSPAPAGETVSSGS